MPDYPAVQVALKKAEGRFRVIDDSIDTILGPIRKAFMDVMKCNVALFRFYPADDSYKKVTNAANWVKFDGERFWSFGFAISLNNNFTQVATMTMHIAPDVEGWNVHIGSGGLTFAPNELQTLALAVTNDIVTQLEQRCVKPNEVLEIKVVQTL